MRIPLSPAARIEMAADSLMGELRQARREVAGQRARGDELERQLAKAYGCWDFPVGLLLGIVVGGWAMWMWMK